MTGARAVVEQLKRVGVRHAFTVPGESFLSVLDALYEEHAISLVATRHEGGAAFIAESVGKLTGVPALCMGTRGIGSANIAVGTTIIGLRTEGSRSIRKQISVRCCTERCAPQHSGGSSVQ